MSNRRSAIDVTIVIPSTCEARRQSSLLRAIESLLRQEGGAPKLLVVANGDRVDPDVVHAIEASGSVRVERRTEGSLPKALHFGASSVDTRYYGFLDDDDEYLPNALAVRRAFLAANPSVDAVVTNGFEVVNGTDRLRVEHPEDVARDPLRALATENWLASCGSLFRAGRVGAEIFNGVPRYYEWTVLAYRIASSRRLAYVDVPTFRVHDSVASLSKSREFREAEVDVLSSIAALPLPADVRRAVAAKIGRAHHGLAGMYLTEGRRGLALRHHLKSLCAPGGVKYLAYSRKLLLPRQVSARA
jgi:glycosyltransferase involved in cell wall biosynthesis